MSQPNTVPVLEKALEVMEYIAARPDGVTRPELRRILNLPQATCYRIVATLLARGWLELRPNKRYALGAGAVTRPGQFLVDRWHDLQPVLNELARTSGFSVKFSVRDGEEFVNVCAARADGEVALLSTPGHRAPLSRIASVGIVILSQLPESERIAAGASPGVFAARRDEYLRTGYAFQPGSNDADAEFPFDTLSFPVNRRGVFAGVLSFLSLPGRILPAIPDLARLASAVSDRLADL